MLIYWLLVWVVLSSRDIISESNISEIKRLFDKFTNFGNGVVIIFLNLLVINFLIIISDIIYLIIKNTVEQRIE
jgi:hypothetical protein